MELIITILFLMRTVMSHEIISTYYGEECDNKICEYVNKVTLNVHGFMFGPQVIGYDNLTNTDIIFDLNSIYVTYGQNIDKLRACIPYYKYDYNCVNEIFGLDYELPCTNSISDGCPDDTFYSIVPYTNGDCMGKQFRYIETVHFANCTEVLCTRSSNYEFRISGTILYNNLTRPFDIMLEYGAINKISDDIRINVVQLNKEYRYPTASLCARNLDDHVVLNLSHYTMDHYMSRRVLSGHLISNFVRDDTEYDFADLLISEKGFMKNEYGTYLFMYYKPNATCIPVPYSDKYDISSHLMKYNGYTVFRDYNCTKRMTLREIYECNMYQGQGYEDSEGNKFCVVEDRLIPVDANRLSSTITDDVIIQLSFTGNYAIKQVFYDRCRIKEIEYINNTLYIYDCEDPIHVKNMYTGMVYKVYNNMTITLPNGVYTVVDYINAPSFLVTENESTTQMYYAEDKMYVMTMLKLGFSVNVIENAKSYLIFYLILILSTLFILVIFIVLIIKLRYKALKCHKSKAQDIEDKGIDEPVFEYNF